MSAPVAIITGASQGIGAGLVTGYRDAGYAVVGVALSLPGSTREGDDHVAIAGDIATPPRRDARWTRRSIGSGGSTR